MLNTELKSNINKLWDKFWSRGLSNPMDSIEQISYLLFIRRLEEMDNEKLENSKSSNEKYISIFDGDYKFVSRERSGGKSEVIEKADFK
jgi:type I restriction enzyme M protein